MNNLSQNYKIILKELQNTCGHINFFIQKRKPKLSDLELVALNLTAEYMMINSELQLFRVLKGTFLEDKIERSVYNKRKRKLFLYIEEIRKTLSAKFTFMSNLYIVDSMPVQICELVRANRSKICSTSDIYPAFGYCASKKMHYFGFKLHLVCDENGVFHSFDLTPANVHDVNYLNDVKNDYRNCEIIGDRGYISQKRQLDLFTESKITLSVPMRKNQKNFQKFSKTKAKIRKMIETRISQLEGQFTLKMNYAKSFQGLITRILSKITALTTIQYLNQFVFHKNIGNLKVNLNAQ